MCVTAAIYVLIPSIHPRTATTPPSKGVLECVRGVVQSQGPQALWKGAIVSALGQVPNNAIVFGSYGSSLAWLARTFPDANAAAGGGGGGGGGWHVFLAGCWAGFLQCLALAPLEHIKCQQQCTDWRPGVRHMSMGECARGLIKAKGVAGGLYRGFWSLVWRCVLLGCLGLRAEGWGVEGWAADLAS